MQVNFDTTQPYNGHDISAAIKFFFELLQSDQRDNLFNDLHLLYGYTKTEDSFHLSNASIDAPVGRLSSYDIEKCLPGEASVVFDDVVTEDTVMTALAEEKSKRGRKAKIKNAPTMVINKPIVPAAANVTHTHDMAVNRSDDTEHTVTAAVGNSYTPVEVTPPFTPPPPPKPAHVEEEPASDAPQDFTGFISIVIDDIQAGKMNQQTMNTLITTASGGAIKNQRELNKNQEWLPAVYQYYKDYMEKLKS